MSRLLVVLSLLTSLSTAALADTAPRMTFAKAPDAVADSAPSELPIQPRIVDRPSALPSGAAARPGQAEAFDRARLRAKLAANRAANIERFRAYRTKGVFPSNVYTPGALNVWRDQTGNYCAAATIIRSSGELALVEQIAETDNFIKLADVTSGPLMDWILTSGLTQAELAQIQLPFMGVRPRQELEPAPEPRIAVDPVLRAKETARLSKLYKKIEATIAKQSKTSLDAAVDRLLRENPDLAYRIAAHG